MASKSPRERLEKLFHKRQQSSKDEGQQKSSPSASASTAGAPRYARRTSSRASLRDMFTTKGRSESRSQNRRSSIDRNHPPQHESRPSTAGAQAAATKALFPDAHVNRSGSAMADQKPLSSSPADGIHLPGTQKHPEGSESDLRQVNQSGRQYRLPSVQHETDLSSDLQHLTVSDKGKMIPFNEDVANRNIAKLQSQRQDLQKPPPVQPNGTVASRGDAQILVPGVGRNSANVAKWNVMQNEKPDVAGSRHAPVPLNIPKTCLPGSTPHLDSPVSPVSSSSHSLSRKADYTDLRHSGDISRTSVEGAQRSKSIKRSSLDKPLPAAPSDEFDADLENEPVVSREIKPDLKGIVDLSSTEDTTLHERWAPAVTHETIREDVHAIREEVITREIHNHHVFHRVLPIVDIEVLPARHFVPVQGGYAEISEDEVPGRTGPNAQWVIAETMSKMLPESKGPVIPQHFSASRFEGPEYNDKEYVGEDGVKRTEQWWVHPPTIETGGRDSGQTYPFYIGFPDPKDNGLRARLPKGNVIGVSPLLARQQREQLGREQELAKGGIDVVAEDPSAAPKHKAFI